ncbi:hypothetical protein K466DRAFT_597174 [Polyporus arcularius HHB13444]|uniref:Uncharacterized protein n=1 Tax=Polyporus arcularius HHB13444 TaxID=1314778 RepID=A0A5C3PMG0_9APHY|nr:hypothetical protein K466DRAFT_597174 [Polyporus arcularius HHB13444]
MVVTRRTPAPPAAASRTHSAQPIPRLAKNASPEAQTVPGKSSPLVNGSTHEVPSKAGGADVDKAAGAASKATKAKGKQKSKKNGQKRSGRGSTGFTELLFRGFLLWFTIYTLSVCPQDEQLKSPVCRGLSEYRRLVIEPYILPPIQQVLAHPSVVPYVEKAKPYADYAVRTAQPIAARVHKEFEARVVPQWNKRVVPLYFKYAVPQLMKLEAQAAPYRSRVEQEYERVLAPYVRLTASTLYRWQRKARPYVALAAEKTYQGYQVARPYARPVWEKVKIVLAQVAAILGEQRRQFVDPHVQKIWEHVKEMSGKPQASAPQLRSSGSSQLSKASSGISKASVKVSSTLSSVVSSVVSGSSAISSSVAVAADQATSVVEAVSSSVLPPVAQTTEVIKSSVVEAAESASSAASSASDALKSTVAAASSTVSQSVSSVVSAASDAVVSPASSFAAAADPAVSAPLSSAEAIPSGASSVAGGVSAAVSDAAVAAGSVVSSALASESLDNLIPSSAIEVASVKVTQSAVASVPEVADAVPSLVASGQEEDAAEHDPLGILSDPDLEEFKAELGLSDDLLSEPEQPDTPVLDEESEQEREERLRARREKTARDRAELDKRHTEWEKKVESLVADSKKALRKALVAIRKAAVTELKENAEIQKEVESLVEDAEKFLRGAEKYMNNLQKENRKLEEKKAYWDRVVSKVEEKFQDRLRQTEAVVNGWYSGILDKEVAEVEKVTRAVKDLAEHAQADIGLDYAYLDDVTYHDWQRYHDLIRRSENFTVHAASIQDGTHPSPPINPVGPAIKELQDEVEDVIHGFNARLRTIKRSGARVFGTPEEEAEDEDGSVSILPIEEPEQTESPADVGVPEGIVIGRGKEEVEAALNRVAELDAQKTSSPDEPEKVKDADAVAQSLKEAVAAEATSASSPSHEEL